MNLKQYISYLQLLLDKDPTLGKAIIIYSHDDEGNQYQVVHNAPSIMYVEGTCGYYVEPTHNGKRKDRKK